MQRKVLLCAIACAFIAAGCSRLPWSAAKQKQYAGTLVDRGLYQQAAAEYQKLLDSGKLSDDESANLAYMVGQIYMDNIHDYENALASFLKVRIYSPGTKLEDELDQRIIECLERTGRSYEAQKELDKRTLLDKPREVSQDTVVAKLGRRNITMKELEGQIKALPVYLQKNYTADDKKLEFLKQYIATELLYDAAKRKNFDKDKDILQQVAQMQKSMIVGKLMQEETGGKTTVPDNEAREYYDSHKADFKKKKYEEAREEITSTLRSEKERSAQQELINKLLKTEKVELYENVFSGKN